MQSHLIQVTIKVPVVIEIVRNVLGLERTIVFHYQLIWWLFSQQTVDLFGV